MPSEAGAIIFYDQSFGGFDLPEGGDDVSEAIRLRAAPVGVYELVSVSSRNTSSVARFFLTMRSLSLNAMNSRNNLTFLKTLRGLKGH